MKRLNKETSDRIHSGELFSFESRAAEAGAASPTRISGSLGQAQGAQVLQIRTKVLNNEFDRCSGTGSKVPCCGLGPDLLEVSTMLTLFSSS